jgi:hypothetical protein
VPLIGISLQGKIRLVGKKYPQTNTQAHFGFSSITKKKMFYNIYYWRQCYKKFVAPDETKYARVLLSVVSIFHGSLFFKSDFILFHCNS